MEPNLWLRQNKEMGIYKYVGVYVNDLAYAIDKHKEFICLLIEKYNFKLSGNDIITFHLGCNFARDNDGVLCVTP